MRPPPSPLPPWRLFFPLAAVSGIAVVVITVLARDGLVAAPPGWSLARWHAHEMLFGHVAAAFAGVLLTALPRWTGCPPITPMTTLALAALWLAGRIGCALGPDGIAPLASPAFLLALALVAGLKITAAHDARDAPLLALLVALAAADALLLADPHGETGAFALRFGLSAMIAIAAVMGGRVAPALTRHLALTRGVDLPVAPPRPLEITTAALTATALLLWTVAAAPVPTSLALGAAAVSHAIRLVWWKGWTTPRRPSILALHVGYAFVPLGLGLLAWEAMVPSTGLADAARHVFGVGVFGVMCLAVQVSVVRRHTGRPLVADRPADLATMILALAVLARLGGALLSNETLLKMSALGWTAAATLLAVTALGRLRTASRTTAAYPTSPSDAAPGLTPAPPTPSSP